MNNVVIFGGGTGLSHLLKSVKDLNINLTVVVTIADDGGSTGKIRDYYNIPAPGDLRRVVLALSDNEHMEELMNYRFDNKLEKHTIGNLMLAALTDIKGDMSKAVDAYCDILDVKEKVLPISNKSLVLMAEMKSGKLVYGESRISKHPEAIAEIGYQDDPQVNKEVLDAVDNADYIIFGCGSLFTSLIANIAMNDVKEHINNSKAEVIYVSNLVTQHGETENYTLENHINVINKHLGQKRVDCVIANDNYNVSSYILDNYKLENSELVLCNKGNSDTKIICGDYLEIINGYIRHDNKKLNKVLKEVVEGKNA